MQLDLLAPYFNVVVVGGDISQAGISLKIK